MGRFASHGKPVLTENLLTNDELKNIVSDQDMETYFRNVEKLDVLNLTKLNPINLPPCHTIFELLTVLNNAIKQRLLHEDNNIGSALGDYNTIQALKNDYEDFLNPSAKVINESGEVTEFLPFRFNTFGRGARDEFDSSSNEPVADFRIRMHGDYRFTVQMNLAFSQSYYIKMHPELFRMFQFKEVQVGDLDKDAFFTEPLTGEKKVRYNRDYLRGRRFMGDRLPGPNRQFMSSMAAANSHKNEYQRIVRGISVVSNRDLSHLATQPSPEQLAALRMQDVETQLNNFVGVTTVLKAELVKMFTAAVSASDSLTRVKSIVFQSSLPTRSESSSGSTYQHFLTDFTLPTASSFSFDVESLQARTVSENLAQEIVYFSQNPSSGRLLMLTDPSPLYEIKLKVLAKCWNFEEENFYFESIPLPPGATFTCKLVFISKNEIHDRKQMDRLQGGT